MKTNDIKLTRNFSLREFECSCCGTVKLHSLLVEKLQDLRELWGKPLVINSGYRCEAHNASVGGVPNGRHMQGLAADLWIPGRLQEGFRILARMSGFSKVLLYENRNFVHVEVDAQEEAAERQGVPVVQGKQGARPVFKMTRLMGTTPGGHKIYQTTTLVLTPENGDRDDIDAQEVPACTARPDRPHEIPPTPPLQYRRALRKVRQYEKHPALPIFTQGVPSKGCLFLRKSTDLRNDFRRPVLLFFLAQRRVRTGQKARLTLLCCASNEFCS